MADWEHVDRIGHPLGGGLYYAPVLTPAGLAEDYEQGYITRTYYVYGFLGLIASRITGETSKHLTIQKLAQRLNFNHNQIRYDLRKLQREGRIELSENPAHYTTCFTITLPRVRQSYLDAQDQPKD